METIKFTSQAIKCAWISLLEVTKPLSSKQPGEKDSTTNPKTTDATSIKQKKHIIGPFTREEVAKHSSPSDCWVILFLIKNLI